ncbi:MAG: hypothetical protein Q8K85_15770, partial [Hyphomicrobium sp.]|nr:hypothetical protein [Hyphomicrobium sp.]
NCEGGRMNAYEAVMIAEGVEEADEKTQLEAWAWLIKTGMCWRLQGWFGRRANDLINGGIISKDGEVLNGGGIE